MPLAMNHVINDIAINFLKKNNLYGPFYGLGSTAPRVNPQGISLCLTTKFAEILGTHFTNLGRVKG